MVYNAKNGELLKAKSALEADMIYNAVIIDIQDGIVKDLVQNPEKFDNKESRAINVTVEIANGEEIVKHSQILTYIETEEGNTGYSERSNLGKYVNKYGKLPEAGDEIKFQTGSEGFGKIKLE